MLSTQEMLDKTVRFRSDVCGEFAISPAPLGGYELFWYRDPTNRETYATSYRKTLQAIVQVMAGIITENIAEHYKARDEALSQLRQNPR